MVFKYVVYKKHGKKWQVYNLYLNYTEICKDLKISRNAVGDLVNNNFSIYSNQWEIVLIV